MTTTQQGTRHEAQGTSRETKQSKTIKDIKHAVIWPRMCQTLGGEAQAIKSLNDGGLFSYVSDIHNPGNKLYILREYADEREWESRRMKAGHSAIPSSLDDANRAQ